MPGPGRQGDGEQRWERAGGKEGVEQEGGGRTNTPQVRQAMNGSDSDYDT